MTVTAFARLSIAVLLMVLVWWQIGSAETIARLRTADVGWMMAAVAMLWAQTILSALRWRLAAARMGIGITPVRAVGEYFLAQLVNQTLPGGVVGDVARAYRSSDQVGLHRAGQVVIFERAVGQIAMLLILLAGLTLVMLRPGAVTLPPQLVLPVMGVAAAVLLLIIVILFIVLARKPLLAIGFLARQMALGLLTAFAILLAFDFSARATGTTLPPIATVSLLPLILFTMVVPVTVSGWGLREGAAATLFPLAGAGAAAGLAASTLFGLMFLTSSLLGVLIFSIHERWNAARGQGVRPRPDRPSKTKTELR